MKKILFSIVLLAWMTGGIAASSVQQLSQKLQHINTMQARFTQVLLTKQDKVLQKNQGYMALARPNKFRWDVQQPNKQMIIADGNFLWIYDVALQQATRKNIKNLNQTSPAALLSGSTQTLHKEFHIKLLSATGNRSVFRLVPKLNNANFQWVKLYFDGNKIIGMSFADNLGQLSKIKFNKITINSPLPQGIFRFVPPKGVDIIKE